MVDKVRPLKLEDAGSGTESDMFPTELDPAEDYVAAKGLAFESNDNRRIDLDVSGNIQFRDVTETTPKTVRQLRTASENLFDNTTGRGFLATTVQGALEELRDRTVFNSATTATTLNGTTTLVVGSNTLQYFTGTATGYSVKLPNATTLTTSRFFNIFNTSSAPITVKLNDNSTLFVLGPLSVGYIYLQTNGTTNGVWNWYQLATSSSGILTYTLSSATIFSTSSQTDVLITGFSITPAAGTYAIFYDSAVFYTTTPKSHWWNLYNGATKITNSERRQSTAASNVYMNDTTSAVSAFNGTNALTVRVRCDNTGTLTVNERSLIMIRIGS